MKAAETRLEKISWLIAAAAVLPGINVWLQSMGSGLVGLAVLDAYMLFPLFGLVAFGLMWSHYMVSALRTLLGINKSSTKKFTEATSWIVLVCIILHPTIFVYSLWRDGFGLPPGSYGAYVAPGLKWAVVIAFFSLLIFLSWELRRWFDNRKWWKYIERLSDLAMILILVHGYKLGGEIQAGWFRYVWLLFALSFTVCLGYLYYKRLSAQKDMVG